MRVMQCTSHVLIAVLLMWSESALAQRNPVEDFDLSGLPTRPTTFKEQMLFDMIKHHAHGDIAGAVPIQHELAAYYRAKRDFARARSADERAQAAEQQGEAVQVMPQTPSGGASRRTSIAGEYICRSKGAGPCATHTKLRLQEGGVWGWSLYSGTYQIVNGRVTFKGSPGGGYGGPPTWGTAMIGQSTLTFDASGEPSV